MIETSTQLTPRESILMEYEKEENRLSREFALAMKEREIELTKFEAKWASWLRIPMTLVKLPLVFPWVIIVGIAYVISVYRNKPIDISMMWEHLR